MAEVKSFEEYCRETFDVKKIFEKPEAFKGYVAISTTQYILGPSCANYFAELGMDRPREAHPSFAAALERAIEHRFVSNALYALIGMAAVLAREGEDAHAAEILAFALHHRFTPALFRDIAERELAGLASRLPAEVLAEAQGRGQTSTLEQIVEAVTPGRVRG